MLRSHVKAQASVLVAHSLRVVIACTSQASPRATATSGFSVVIISLLRCEELLHLVVSLRHLLLEGGSSWFLPRLLVLREDRLHQLHLPRLLQALHLDGEKGKLCDRLPPFLCIPVANILLLQFLGEPPNFRIAGDLITAFHMFQGEEYVVLAAHVVEAEERRRAVNGGRQHGLRHDA
jgi:hypothetical protein